MTSTYFLGSNSKDGFASLYDSFPGEGVFLHIIKSGPGTGKSGFMRRIGKYAEEQGLDVEYVLCSGDPDSLDGVYIPGLKTAWVDGTAPHVTEPAFFGVSSDYVNLGRFCRLPFSEPEAQHVRALNSSYKALYRRAYASLAAAAALSAAAPAAFSEDELSVVRRRISSVLERQLTHPTPSPGRLTRRFLSANSCLGRVMLDCSVNSLCKLIYQIDDAFLGAAPALDYACRRALELGADVIACPSPLCPEQLEAVLIPAYGLAFAGGEWEFEKVRHMRIDSLIPVERQRALRPALREVNALRGRCLNLAYDRLREAKALHDELESVYKAHMDFPALDAYTASVIEVTFA